MTDIKCCDARVAQPGISYLTGGVKRVAVTTAEKRGASAEPIGTEVGPTHLKLARRGAIGPCLEQEWIFCHCSPRLVEANVVIQLRRH